jgi:hypothetical protein
VAIQFIAVVSRVGTLADGGIRFTFDVDESQTLQAAELMECKRMGIVLTVTAESVQNTLESGYGRENTVAKGSKRKSRWQASQGAGTDNDTGASRQQDR